MNYLARCPPRYQAGADVVYRTAVNYRAGCSPRYQAGSDVV